MLYKMNNSKVSAKQRQFHYSNCSAHFELKLQYVAILTGLVSLASLPLDHDELTGVVECCVQLASPGGVYGRVGQQD